jgi:hypothetical protein
MLSRRTVVPRHYFSSLRNFSQAFALYPASTMLYIFFNDILAFLGASRAHLELDMGFHELHVGTLREWFPKAFKWVG